MKRWSNESSSRFPNGLPEPYTHEPTQWIFHGHPCGAVVWDETKKRTAQGSLRTDATVLQVAVARLLGYRWPAEQDASMDLADEQQGWVRRCDALQDFKDRDGVVCLPPVRGELPAADRLLQLLVAAFGDAWTDGMHARLLEACGRPTFHEWLRDQFFWSTL